MAAKKVKEPQETALQALKRKADEAFKTGNTERAAALLFTAVYNDSGDFDALSRLYGIAQNYFYQEQFDRALAIFMPLNIMELDFFAERDYATFLAGMSLVHLGVKEHGEMLMEKGIEDDDSNPWFTQAFGFYLLSENRLEEGIRYLKVNVEINSGREDVEPIIEAIAWAEFKRGHPKEALEYILDNLWLLSARSREKLFKRFLPLVDDNTAFEALLRIVREIRDEWDEDSDLFTTLLPIVARRLGKQPQQVGQKDLESAFEIIAELSSHKFEGNLAAGKAYLELGNVDAALELAQQAAVLEPDNVLVYALLAQVQLVQDAFGEALHAADTGLSFFTKVGPKNAGEEQPQRRSDPFAPPNTEDLGAGQQEAQLTARAELLLAKADALVNLEKLDDALETVKEAQRLHPNEIIFYNYAATLLLRMDQPKAAAEQIAAARKQGLKLDPLAQKLNRKIKAALARKD